MQYFCWNTAVGTAEGSMFAATKKFGTSLRRSGVPALALALALFSAILWDGPAQAAKRVALVIGNADYRASNWARLPNAVNDATDIAAALGRLGFAVTSLNNAGKAETVRSLRRFSKAAAGAELALIFYAGHSIEVDKRNFLIPVDASADDPGSVAREAVPLERLLRAGSTADGLRLVLLDACRDNPFAGRILPGRAAHAVGVGLGPPADVSGEILVAYAAKAGTQASDGVGRNSPYTAALRYYLEKPGLEVGLLLRFVRDAVVAVSQGAQQPFVYGSQSARLTYFKPPLELASPPARLAGPASVEERLDLTQRQRRRIQVALWAQGFNPGLPTGRFDGRTREKIAEWQAHYGRKATGFLDGEAAFGSLLTEVSDPSGPVWLTTENRPCTVWTVFPQPGVMTATWSGDCVEGRAYGRGRLVLKYSNATHAFDGEMEDGRLQGHGTKTFLSGPRKGSRFEGEFRDGMENGHGIAKFWNGDSHEGEYRNGKRHGRGTYIHADGHRYEGEFRNDNMHGRGTLIHAGGYRYEGEYRNGKRHGRGIYTHAEGHRYEGEFRNHKAHGRGTLVFANGSRYEGEYKNNKMDGRGIYIDAGGGRYEGEFKNGNRHGYGKSELADGNRYEGEYKNDKYHGHGKFTWHNGDRYEGEFREGILHGSGTRTWGSGFAKGDRFVGEYRNGKKHRGTYMWSDGDRYEGEYRNNNRHGRGTYTHASGSRYEGEWRNDKKHGRGTNTRADGRRYEGLWRNNKRHGRGTYIWPNGARYEGEWRNGKPEGKGVYRDSEKRIYEGDWREGCFGIVDGKQIFLGTTAKACGFDQ